MHLNQVTLPAQSIAASVAFYRRLGFEQLVEAPHYARFRSVEGDATFSVHATESSASEPGVVVYFEVRDLDAKVAALKAAGVVFDTEPADQPWKWREARLQDPSGNALCLFYAGRHRLDPPWRVRHDGDTATSDDGYEVSADRGRLELDVIHGYLTRSYWSPGIPRDVVERGMAHSLCYGVYDASGQVGFARVITDQATFAYLSDVFILEAHRGRGLSKRLMAFIMARPELQGLRRFLLITRDAHALYAQFGFAAPRNPAGVMEIARPDIYRELA